VSVAKVLPYGAIALLVLCPLPFLAGVLAPRRSVFWDPLVCPEGYQLGNQSSDYVSPEGGTGIAIDMVCTVLVGQLMPRRECL